MSRTPELDKLFAKQPTLEPCPRCAGVAVVGERCRVCNGTGLVSKAVADEWRVKHGEPKRYGPLPPVNPPPRR